MIEINRILCPIDFSECSDSALWYAMKMAARYGASLHVLHVMPPLPPVASAVAADGRQLATRNLNSAIERWREPGVDVGAELVESASPSEQIMQRAEALAVDLVVTGSHGRTGMRRMLLGSVVEQLLHHCRQPVLVVPAGLDRSRPERTIGVSRILCAIDFSAASVAALAYALSIAEEADATLTLLNVIELPPELINPPQPPDFNIESARADTEAERLAKLRALIPEHASEYCTVETLVLEGGASRQILRVAEQQQTELIVLGVHGRNPLALAVFGSSSKDVITRAHCPVLVVPSLRHRGGARVRSKRGHTEPVFVL
jgi:nucleotide-binding universal stress UspA family protein